MTMHYCHESVGLFVHFAHSAVFIINLELTKISPEQSCDVSIEDLRTDKYPHIFVLHLSTFYDDAVFSKSSSFIPRS